MTKEEDFYWVINVLRNKVELEYANEGLIDEKDGELIIKYLELCRSEYKRLLK